MDTLTQQSSSGPSATRILVVEDEPALAEAYCRILSRNVLPPVRRSESLGEALLSIGEAAPDVILLDLGLPDSQGLQGLTQLRKRAPDAAVIITTGLSDETLAIEALRNGAQDYLLKGKLDASTLVRSVRYALERKQTENKLRRSEELFSVITNNVVDLISIINARGERLYTSPSYQRLLGYTEDELRDLSFADLVHPEDRPKIEAGLQQLFMDGSSHGVEYRLRHRNGFYIHVESNAVSILDSLTGTPQGIFVARDITARKQAEAERERMEIQLRQAQKLESIGHLAAGIAHEINTPTQYIGDNVAFLLDAFRDLARIAESHRSLLELFAKGELTPEAAAQARKIMEEADPDFLLAEIPTALAQSLEGVKRVTRIVSAMKEFSHPGSDTKTRTDLNRAIESTVTVCRNEWKYVADLELELAPDLPLVPCLPGEFNQAVLNLIINAAHAIETTRGAGKGTIRIRTHALEEAVEVVIQDNGGGIPEQIRAHIFDPFFTTKPVGKGTGQGLAIVHSVIVERHGGTISVESEVDKGTTFVLRLPLKEA